MQTNKSKQFWKTYNETEINEITNGFKQLYNHKPNKKAITTNQLLYIMEQNMNNILFYEQKYKEYIQLHFFQNLKQKTEMALSNIKS